MSRLTIHCHIFWTNFEVYHFCSDGFEDSVNVLAALLRMVRHKTSWNTLKYILSNNMLIIKHLILERCHLHWRMIILVQYKFLKKHTLSYSSFCWQGWILYKFIWISCHCRTKLHIQLFKISITKIAWFHFFFLLVNYESILM